VKLHTEQLHDFFILTGIIGWCSEGQWGGWGMWHVD